MLVDEGFEDWYLAQHGRLVAAIVLVVGDVDEAQDVVDEAFSRALAAWGRVGSMERREAWVYRVAVNAARRRWRRRALEARFITPSRVEVPPPAGEAWDAVARLPVRQRTAVVLRHVADLPEAEIALVMGVTRSTVSTTLRAAYRRLATNLGDGGI